MRRQAGFTLIELLIVVAVIAVLAAICVPNFLEAQVRSKVAVAEDDLHSLAVAAEAYWVEQRAYPPNLAKLAVVKAPEKEAPPETGIFRQQRIELADGRWLCETNDSVLARVGELPKPAAQQPPGVPAPAFPYWDRTGVSRYYPLAYNSAALRRLTTPVPYLGMLPADVFAPREGGTLYRPPAVFGPTDPNAKPSWDLYNLRPFSYCNFTAIDRDGLPLPHSGRSVTYVIISPGPDGRYDFTDPSHPPAHYDPTNGSVSAGDLILEGSL